MEKVPLTGDSARRTEDSVVTDRGIDRLALQMDLASLDAESAKKKEGHRDFRERYLSGFGPLKST